MSFITQHKLIVIVAVLLALVGGWYFLSGSPASAPSLTTTPVAGATSPADQNLVSTLLALRAVKLDGTIFSDPSFLSLKDFSTQIVPEPVGRPDPFAPLSVSPSTSASSTHSAQIFSPRQQ